MSKSEPDIIHRTRVVVVGLIALLIIGSVGSAVVWRMRLAHEVNGRLAALRAAGLPTSGTELNQWYAQASNAENAALVMTQAFQLMRTFPDNRSNEVLRFKLPPRGQKPNSGELELLMEYVELNREALSQARAVLTRLGSRYPIDLTPGPNALVPHLSKLKVLAQAASYLALLSAESGDVSEADNAIETILGLARTLDNEPLLISQLVRIALLNMAVSSLERRLAAGQFTDRELLHLSRAFNDAERTKPLVRALIGERAMAISSFRMSTAEAKRLVRINEEGSAEVPGARPLPGPQPILLRITGFFERDLNFFLRAMETNILAAGHAPPRSLQFNHSIEPNVANAEKRFHILSGLLLPAISRTLVKHAQTDARLRIATVAIGVERFRLSNGRLPNDLNELLPASLSMVPADPFDGVPLRYQLRSNGFVVYSIGPDGHDDGGREPPLRRRSTEHLPEDITITVER